MALFRASLNELTHDIIGAAIEVHRELGPGLLESMYEECMGLELRERKLEFRRQVPVPVTYKGRNLGADYRLDLLVEDRVIVKLKTVDKLAGLHEAQLLTYLKVTGMPVGLLINFNTDVLRKGVRRFLNN